MTDRKWLPSGGELLDRLSIVTLKYHFNPDNREATKKEIEDLRHDIQLCLSESGHVQLTADFLYHLIVLAQSNLFIWQNESSARKGDPAKANLYYTHQQNGTRCRFRDFITNKLKGRVDPKVDALAADIPDFEPPK